MAFMNKAIAGACFLALGACGAAHAQTPKAGGILKFAVVAEPPSIDCHVVNTFAFIHPARAHYSTLLAFKGSYADLRIVGDLATGWEVAPDGLSYTFKLRDNVKFHDGSQLTSEDVKASYERIIDPPAGVVSLRRALYQDIKSIETPDAWTVVFRMKFPNASMLTHFASPWNCIYSAAKLREAFGLVEFDPDEDVVVVVPDPDLEEDQDEPIGSPAVRPTRTIETTTGPYQLPPLDLLRSAPPSNADVRDEQDMQIALERTLQTFGVDARVSAAHRGPTVTMYEVEVASGTKVNKVLQLASDIAYALATPDVRIQAPIPGKSAIGIEVPNKHRDFVMLGDILRSKAAKEATHPLEVALGKDIHGRARMVNLATMPHLLIAGATGAGKSSLVNSFITSLLARTTPEDVRLVLVDPKRVELGHFADVPHLLSPVIVHPKRAAEALGWIVREMEQRYELLATAAVRDIDGYEEGLRAGTLRVPLGLEHRFGHLPFIVVVIDELADLMMVAPRDVEDAICRIAQMARAVGIHLVVATQRPSVDVVTGLIKANIPSRIALMTSSQADSRVILDMNGAEKLVGHGDMLFAPSSISKPVRLQGAWVTEQEIGDVTDFIRAQREAVYEHSVEGLGLPPAETAGGDHALGSDDDLLEQAAELVIRSQLGSTSMLQRKLKVGFARAGRLMDLMEDQGIVGPSQGSKARDVLVTWEEWEERRTA